MSIQALRHHAMAVAADIVRQSPCDALASRASVVGRDYTQALPVGLLNKFWSSPSHKSGRDRSGRDRRSKHPSRPKGCHPNRGPLIQNRWWHLT